MNLIIKYRHKIVTFGLIPMILTLIGINFFTEEYILGLGLLLAIIMLAYDYFVLKGFNIFLFYSVIGLGIMFPLRLFLGPEFVPYPSIAPGLELYLGICAFINITLPDLYCGFLRKHNLYVSNYDFECKVIVAFCVVHLLVRVGIAMSHANPYDQIGRVIDAIVPIAVYCITIIINTIGLMIAIEDSPTKTSIIRIAPICNGRLYLRKYYVKSKEGFVWDLPIKEVYDGPVTESNLFVKKISKRYTSLMKTPMDPRFIWHYKLKKNSDQSPVVLLYILPMDDEKLLAGDEGRFFDFTEINVDEKFYSPELKVEYDQLMMTAEIWQEMGNV